MVCAYKSRSTIFLQEIVSRASSPGTSQHAKQTRDNTDPACVISVDCARGFAPEVLRS